MKNINRRSMARKQSRKVPGSPPTIGICQNCNYLQSSYW